jgi:hypothetical protein
MESTRYYFQFFTKLGFCQQISERTSNIKFHDNLSCVRRVVPCGQRDRDEDSLLSEFCERV